MKRAKSPPAKPEAPSAWELGKDLFEPITDETPQRNNAMHSKRLLRERFRGVHDLGPPFIGGEQGDGSDVSGNIKAALRKRHPAS